MVFQTQLKASQSSKRPFLRRYEHAGSEITDDNKESKKIFVMHRIRNGLLTRHARESIRLNSAGHSSWSLNNVGSNKLYHWSELHKHPRKTKMAQQQNLNGKREQKKKKKRERKCYFVHYYCTSLRLLNYMVYEMPDNYLW
jgi:hypothetical protein